MTGVAGEGARIRPATPGDAAGLLAVYAPYVQGTAISFECEVPSLAEFRGRVAHTLATGRPYLVAEDATGLLGYAYTSAFVGRAAYLWAEETTIYLRKDARGHGLGRRLYQALEDMCRLRGVLNLEACVGYAEPEDEHLTNASARFHERMGYRLVGRFHRCGHKFGTWYDMVWMEKVLGEHVPAPTAPRRFDELPGDALAGCGVSPSVGR